MRFHWVAVSAMVLTVAMLTATDAGTQELCFMAAVNYAAGAVPYSVFAADLDGDGDFDLAVANVGSNNVSILRNNGDGTFQGAVNYAAGESPRSVLATDMDGDNDNDLAVGDANGQNVMVLINCVVPRPALASDVDILPGQCPNDVPISEAREIDVPHGAGVVPGGRLLPVAMLGSPVFDVHQVNLTSIDILELHPLTHEYEDVAGSGVPTESGDCECGTAGPDGYTDLVLMFDLDSVLALLSPCHPGDVRLLELTARTLNGRDLAGRDCINLKEIVAVGGGGGSPVVARPSRPTRMERLSPNPFNASTGITYALGDAENVHLDIYDILGRRVRTLVSEAQTAGEHEVTWDGTDDRGQAVSSGVYFCRLQTESHVDVRQMVLLK
ncbi:MAG: FlgD immunoglobulin-like domain containing protein [Candidatus Zixiibacteriota bacterium]